MNNYVTFLELGKYGRFANQLFQIAGTIGVARKNGMEPVFPRWYNLDHREKFGSPEDIDVFNHLVQPLPAPTVWPDMSSLITVPIQWGYHDIRLLPGYNYNLSGHLQSLKYFDHCLPEVREALRMKGEFPQSKYVAVHVRRGDYDDKYHPRLGRDYYQAAIGTFTIGTKFKIFSDEIHLVRDEFYSWFGADFADKYCAFINLDEPTYDYLGSFKLMKSCQHFIIGNSSYSAMAAILSEARGKRVIAPRNWFGASYTSINANDIYCPGWEVV